MVRRRAEQRRRLRQGERRAAGQAGRDAAGEDGAASNHRIERVNGNTLVKPRMSVISSTTKMVRMMPRMSLAPAGATVDLLRKLRHLGVGQRIDTRPHLLRIDAALLQALHDIGAGERGEHMRPRRALGLHPLRHGDLFGADQRGVGTLHETGEAHTDGHEGSQQSANHHDGTSPGSLRMDASHGDARRW